LLRPYQLVFLKYLNDGIEVTVTNTYAPSYRLPERQNYVFFHLFFMEIESTK
jgi:hypothetical protein